MIAVASQRTQWERVEVPWYRIERERTPRNAVPRRSGKSAVWIQYDNCAVWSPTTPWQHSKVAVWTPWLSVVLAWRSHGVLYDATALLPSSHGASMGLPRSVCNLSRYNSDCTELPWRSLRSNRASMALPGRFHGVLWVVIAIPRHCHWQNAVGAP